MDSSFPFQIGGAVKPPVGMKASFDDLPVLLRRPVVEGIRLSIGHDPWVGVGEDLSVCNRRKVAGERVKGGCVLRARHYGLQRTGTEDIGAYNWGPHWALWWEHSDTLMWPIRSFCLCCLLAS